MGAISLEKSAQMYWLGRYMERVFITMQNYIKCFDKSIDAPGEAYQAYCRALGMEDIYHSDEAFFERYLYDEKDCSSVAFSLERAFDNAIVLRNEISTEALAYIHLAQEKLAESKVDSEHLIVLQSIVDQLYAFWGCIDDEVEDEDHRNIIKVGRYVERLDLCMRLKVDQQLINKAFRKLKDRIQRLSRPYDDEKLFRLGEILKMEDWTERAGEALMYVNSLFEVPVE